MNDARKEQEEFVLNENNFKKYFKICNIYFNFFQMKARKNVFSFKLKHSVLNQTTKG